MIPGDPPPPAEVGYRYVGIVMIDGVPHWMYEEIDGPGSYVVPVTHPAPPPEKDTPQPAIG